MVLVSIPPKVYGTKTKICDKCYTSSPYARSRFMHYKAQYLTSTVYRPQRQEWTAILAGISLAIAKKQKWCVFIAGECEIFFAKFSEKNETGSKDKRERDYQQKREKVHRQPSIARAGFSGTWKKKGRPLVFQKIHHKVQRLVIVFRHLPTGHCDRPFCLEKDTDWRHHFVNSRALISRSSVQPKLRQHSY